MIENLDRQIAAAEAELDRLSEAFRTNWCGTLIMKTMRPVEKLLRELRAMRARMIIYEALSSPGIIFLVSKRPVFQVLEKPESREVPSISVDALTLATGFMTGLFNPSRNIAELYRSGKHLGR